MIHDDKTCTKYNEPVLPNELGRCSLCNAKLMTEFERESIRHFLVDTGYHEYADIMLATDKELEKIANDMQGEYAGWCQQEYK